MKQVCGEISGLQHEAQVQLCLETLYLITQVPVTGFSYSRKEGHRLVVPKEAKLTPLWPWCLQEHPGASPGSVSPGKGWQHHGATRGTGMGTGCRVPLEKEPGKHLGWGRARAGYLLPRKGRCSQV